MSGDESMEKTFATARILLENGKTDQVLEFVWRVAYLRGAVDELARQSEWLKELRDKFLQPI